MIGKDKILDYCNQHTNNMYIKHIEDCKNVLTLIEKSQYHSLGKIGCPIQFGLSILDMKDKLKCLNGLYDDKNTKDHIELCSECWEEALNAKCIPVYSEFEDAADNDSNADSNDT